MVPEEVSFEFYQKCISDFPFFVEKVLGYNLADFHLEQIDLMLRHRYTCVITPVSHGKTTLFSVSLPLWLLWKEKDFNICLVSSTEEQAQRALGIIQKTIETNPFLKHLVPSAKTVKWGSSYIHTTNGSKCYTKPFSDSARGIQPDLIVYDDLLRSRDVNMDLIKEIFWSVFIPRGQARGCKHVVVGTPQSDDDLLTDIEKDHTEMWATVRKAAVITNERGDWIKPLWPAVFSLKQLDDLKKAVGLYRFNREFMCQPSGLEGGLFPPDMIAGSCDDDLGFSYKIEGDSFVGGDFAMSKSSTGDFTVITAVDSLSGNHMINGREIVDPIIIKHMTRNKGGNRIWNNTKLNWYNKTFLPQKMVLDGTTFGAVFVNDLQADGIFAISQGFRPDQRNKLLLNLRRLMEDGRIVIPTKEDEQFTFGVTKHLLSELKGFEEKKTPGGLKTFKTNKKHDDSVMSLAMAVSQIVEMRPMLDSFILSK